MANPYAAGSPEAFEYDVWDRGTQAGGSERDFLRAFHTKQGLIDLQACIQSAINVKPRITSLWIDRYPIARPHLPSTPGPRELADLAIVVRLLGSRGLRQRMLLVQGKVDKPSWQKNGSSPKEIDFLEKVPVFDLFTSAHSQAKPLGQFNLRSDFGAPPYAGIPFWAYLLFAPSTTPAVKQTPSHASAAWPNNLTTHKPFFTCVIEQTRSCMTSPSIPGGTASCMPPWGADVQRGTSCKEWRRLYVTLAHHVRRKVASKLTGGAWKNIAQFALPLEAVSLVAGGHDDTFGLISTGFTTRVGDVATHHKLFDFRGAEIREWTNYRRTMDTDIDDDDDGPSPPGEQDANDDGPGFGMMYVDLIEPSYETRG